MDKRSPTPAAWRRLHELASEVHALAPWTWMDEEMVFGVRSGEGGEPNFVSLMGKAGQHLSVAVYLGSEGLRGFQRMCEAEVRPSSEQLLETPQLQASFEDRAELEPEDRAIVKELGLSFRGRMAWPMFRSTRPGCLPWFVEAWEVEILVEVLEQVLEVAPRVRRNPPALGPGDGRTFLVRSKTDGLGAEAWTERLETLLMPAAAPTETSVNAGTVEKVRRLPRGDHPVEVSLFGSMATIQAERERPRLPYVLLLVDSDTGMVLGVETLAVESGLQAMLALVPQCLCRALEKAAQVPRVMRTDSARLAGLVGDLVSELGIRMEQVSDLPALEEVRQGLEEHVSAGPAGSGGKQGRATGRKRGLAPSATTPGRRGGGALERETADSGGGVERVPARAAEASTGAKVGRNDPCPCGSGKKYKKCCLAAEKGSGAELTPQVLKRCAGDATNALIEYAHKTYGGEFVSWAWGEFWSSELDLDLEGLSDDPYTPFFFAWLIFLWVPGDPDEDCEESCFPSEGTVAAGFLRTGARGVDELTRRFIDTARRAPLSFWQVEETDPGAGALLRDMVTDRRCFLNDRSLAEHADQGEIVFCQVVEMDGVAITGGAAPYLLPPAPFRRDVEAALKPVRAQLQEDADAYPAVLLERDLDLMDLYHTWVERFLGLGEPELRNSDGDPLEWARSVYAFDPAQRGRLLGRLESMRNIERDEDDELWDKDEEEGEFGDEDEGEEIAMFVWMSPRRKDGKPQVSKATMGVNDDEVHVEANSRRRERTLRERLLKNLGELLTYEGTEYKPAGAEALWMEEGDYGDEEDGALDLELLEPQDRTRLEEALAQRYLTWADDEVPALGGKTPREMMKTVEGRAEVEKMVNEWENMDRGRPNAQFRFEFNLLRRHLGLAEE